MTESYYDDYKYLDKGSDDGNTIQIIGNRIYFYTDIASDTILELNKCLYEKNSKNIYKKILNGENALNPIYLHINSPGGFVFDSFSGFDTIQRIDSDVYTIVDGHCASGATILSIAGSKRFITKHSIMMIHELRSGFWGKYSDFEDEKKNLDLMMNQIKQVYVENTKIPNKVLNDILKRDLYINADQALEYGLVDEII